MSYFIIVFKNTHTAMSGEKILEGEGFKFRIMPTPTSITQSCGIWIRIEDEEQISKITNGDILEYKAIYKRSSNGYEVIKEY